MRDLQHVPVVGRVAGLWRYPVKSMAGEALAVAEVSWHGFAGDRRWAFVREDAPRSGFPWLTLRERADMNHYVPRLVDAARPDNSDTRVRTPSGQEFDVIDPALAALLYPSGARAIKQDRGIFDTFPLSLITLQTIRELARRAGIALGVERFRPNILVDAAETAPFAEDAWVGRTLRIGEAEIRIDKRDGRCAVITIDPATGERTPDVLGIVARERQGCLGVYGTTVTPGSIPIDAAIHIEPASPQRT
ncbi:MAG: MOSC domain-containing protein [Planctomycetota bacterium]